MPRNAHPDVFKKEFALDALPSVSAPDVEKSGAMPQTRTHRAVWGFVSSLLQSALIMLLQFTLVPIVLRLAGQEVLGAYSILLQVISWGALTDLGFGVATSRELAQAHGEEDQGHRFATVFATGRTFMLGSNLVFTLLILMACWKIQLWIPLSPAVAVQARIALAVFAAWVTLRTPFALYTDALIARQNLAAANVILAIGNAGRLLLSLVLVWNGAGLVGLMIANVAGELLTLAASKYWYQRLHPMRHFSWGFPDRPLFRRMLGFGSTYMLMIVGGRLSSSTDVLVIGSLYGAAAASVYYTGQIIGTTLYQLMFRLTDSAAPALNELYARGATRRCALAYQRLLRASLILVLPLAIGLISFQGEIITRWLGKPQYAGLIFTACLAAFAITQVVIHLDAILLVAFGEVRLMSTLSVCMGIVKVVLAVVLGKAAGVAGVMAANALADLPLVFVFSRSVWRVLGLGTYDVWLDAIRRPLLAVLPSALVAVAHIIVETDGSTSLVRSAVWIMLFVVFSAGGIWKIGLVRSERERIPTMAREQFAFVWRRV